jgi:Divergent InlB B-repeat domain
MVAISSFCIRVLLNGCKAILVLVAVCALPRGACAQTVSVTIQTVPPGLLVDFNGTGGSAPRTFTGLIPGASVFVQTYTPQVTQLGAREVFSNWSHGAPIAHSLIVPSSDLVLTANFVSQYQITVAAARGGSATPASGQYFDVGSTINVNAIPGAGYTFNAWVGPVANTAQSATTVSMDTPKTVTATFKSTNPILNIDNSGEADASKYGAATDGVLLIRYLLGFRGVALVNGALGSGPALRNSTQIEQHIQSNLSFFDVDGDGLVLVHSDALMILRRLSAPNANPADGAAANAITANAKRSTRSDELVVRAIDLMRP